LGFKLRPFSFPPTHTDASSSMCDFLIGRLQLPLVFLRVQANTTQHLNKVFPLPQTVRCKLNTKKSCTNKKNNFILHTL